MIVVDSSALICVLQQEPDMPQFRTVLLREIGKLRMSASTYLETAIVIDANENASLGDNLDALIEYLEIEIVPVTTEHAKIARMAYRAYGKGYHAARLNFGDCFSYALAMAENAPLLFKGDDFAKTDVLRAL